MHIPDAVYRIQFNSGFDFNSAGRIISYLAELGVSDIYASPIFKAKKSSSHGYDIVDPRELNPELGSEADFSKLIKEVKSHGLYWLQDIVPNHMAFDSQNVALMDVLENGDSSPYFDFFDINWNHPYESMRGRLLAPFLGKFYAECLENAELQLSYKESGLSVNYYEHSFPLKIESYPQFFEHDIPKLESCMGAADSDFMKFLGAVHFLKTLSSKNAAEQHYDQITHAKNILWDLYRGNERIKQFVDSNISFFNGEKGCPASFDALDRLISGQLFRLSFWKVAAEEINYRRFFTINELISLKIENEKVFNFTHDLILKFVTEGKFDGLRIDHIDGLYDPAGYLRRLRERVPDKYIVVEKILDYKEELSAAWPVQGTTGYDFLNYANGVFCDKNNEKEFSKIYFKFTGLHSLYDDLVCEKKRMIIGKHLAGNIDNLALLIKKISSNDRYGRDITLYGLRRALVEVMAHFPIYRTYISLEINSGNDQEYIKDAISRAKQQAPGLVYELNFIEKFLILDFDKSLSEEEKKEYANVQMNFQQYTAALMAKGFEDTILYIYNKLISLNEVGSNPNLFGFSAEEFHGFNKIRAEAFPHSFCATSTHDTKRGEDVRARINVLSELPKEWEYHLKNWSKINRVRKRKIKGKYAPDENDEYFIYQTLLGAFPFDESEIYSFKERIKDYMIKAVREAKVHTAWLKPDSEYEEGCVSFIEEVFNPQQKNRFLEEFRGFQKKIAWYGIFNSLSQVLLKMTSPGVPDFYQGTELWDFSLVDPDNRRPVDFQKRAAVLAQIKSGDSQNPLNLINQLLSRPEDAGIKLFLIYKILQLKKRKKDVFQKGEYLSLEPSGRLKDNVVSFARRHNGDYAVVVAPRFFTGIAKESEIPVAQAWKDTFICLPEGGPDSWTDALTGQPVKSNSGNLSLEEVLKYFPAAILYAGA